MATDCNAQSILPMALMDVALTGLATFPQLVLKPMQCSTTAKLNFYVILVKSYGKSEQNAICYHLSDIETALISTVPIARA